MKREKNLKKERKKLRSQRHQRKNPQLRGRDEYEIRFWGNVCERDGREMRRMNERLKAGLR